jgi:hypothetical protein
VRLKFLGYFVGCLCLYLSNELRNECVLILKAEQYSWKGAALEGAEHCLIVV